MLFCIEFVHEDVLRNETSRLIVSTAELKIYIDEYLGFHRKEDVRLVNVILLQVESMMQRVLFECADMHDRYKITGRSLAFARLSFSTYCGADGSGPSDDDYSTVTISLAKDISSLITRLMAIVKVMSLTA